MDKVYVVRCPEYSQAGEKTTALIDRMGGIGRFTSRGEKIVLKPNLLAAAEPEKAVTTHPSVLTAVALLAKSAGADVLIADSPGSGYPYTEKALQRTYRVTGLDGAAEEADVPLNFDTSHEVVSYPEGERFKRFEIITPVVRADAVFNLCKLKTHSFMHMTCAVKNIFGVIAGLTKPGYHAKLKEKAHFANMLLDLAACVSRVSNSLRPSPRCLTGSSHCSTRSSRTVSLSNPAFLTRSASLAGHAGMPAPCMSSRLPAKKPLPLSKTRTVSAATAATRCARMMPSSSTPASCTVFSTGASPRLRMVRAGPGLSFGIREGTGDSTHVDRSVEKSPEAGVLADVLECGKDVKIIRIGIS